MEKKKKGKTSNTIPLKKVKSFGFGIMNDDIFNDFSFKVQNATRETGHSGMMTGPLYDPKMGPSSSGEKCAKCELGVDECPGHSGHYVFSDYVILPGSEKIISSILNCSCVFCGDLLIDENKKNLLLLRAPSKRLKACERYMNLVNKDLENPRHCPNCGMDNLDHYVFDTANFITMRKDQKNKDLKIIHPNEDIKIVIKRLKPSSLEYLGFSEKNHPHNLITNKMIVIPPTARPQTISTNGPEEDKLSTIIINIITADKKLNEKKNKTNDPKDYYTEFALLSKHIEVMYFGADTKSINTSRPLKPIKEILKGKAGHVRKKQQSHNVAYVARSVITADGSLDADQLGVPQAVAMILTIPEVVNEYNMDEMKKLVMNGEDKYPGASVLVVDGANYKILPKMNKKEKNEMIKLLKPGAILRRHIRDEDPVMFNRQPAIHRFSIMELRIKIIKEEGSDIDPTKKVWSIRMNPAICSPYNADFDGDEMNMFLPLSSYAQTEAEILMGVKNNIVSCNTRSAHIGVIQDTIIGLYLIARDKNKAISKELYLDIVGATQNHDRLVHKNKYTYRDVLNSFLPANFCFSSFTEDKVRDILKKFDIKPPERYVNPLQTLIDIFGEKEYIKHTDIFDKVNEVLVLNGTFVFGRLNKSSIAQIIKYIFLNYGGDAAIKLISTFQKGSDRFLLKYGFTISLNDCYIGEEVTKKNNKLIADAIYEGDKVANSNTTLIGQYESALSTLVENTINPKLLEVEDNIKKAIDGSENALYIMTDSKARGDFANIRQIVGLIGQQSIEGNRIESSNMITKRIHPYELKYSKSIISHGLVPESFSSGMTSLISLYSHTSGSRIGIIDTAINTAKNGDLGRKLHQKEEDIVVNYDLKVTTNDGKIVEMLYGGCGISGEYMYDIQLKSVKMDNKTFKNTYF